MRRRTEDIEVEEEHEVENAWSRRSARSRARSQRCGEREEVVVVEEGARWWCTGGGHGERKEVVVVVVVVVEEEVVVVVELVVVMEECARRWSWSRGGGGHGRVVEEVVVVVVMVVVVRKKVVVPEKVRTPARCGSKLLAPPTTGKPNVWLSGLFSTPSLPSTSDVSPRRTAPVAGGELGCGICPRTSSTLDRDARQCHESGCVRGHVQALVMR
jgi:hypothetical protein